jgi:hypothetical protein
MGGAGFAPGKVGQAFSFDGVVDDFVSGKTTTGFPFGNSPRTITAWIQAASTGPLDSIIFHYGVGTANLPPTNFHLLMTADGRAAVGNGFGYGLAEGATFLANGNSTSLQVSMKVLPRILHEFTLMESKRDLPSLSLRTPRKGDLKLGRSYL